MRHSLFRATVLVSLLAGASLAYALSTGPVATRTGAPAFFNKPAEPTCQLCHGVGVLPSPPPLNDPSGMLRILDVPARYVPGQIYTLRVQLQHTWNPLPDDPPRWGFQMQAIQGSTGDSAGTWILGANTPPDTFRIRPGLSSSVYRNRRYIEHTRNVSTDVGSNHTGELGPVTWHVNWQAPPGDSGKIYFFAAGNSANGDLQSTGSPDYIFTTSESTEAQGSVDVPPPHPSPLNLANVLADPYPNPMGKCTSIDFTIRRGGLVDLAVFDLQGRRVRTIFREIREAGSHGTYWDGRGDSGAFLRNGLYFIRLVPPGEKKPITQKVTLAR